MITGLIAGLEDGEHAVALICARSDEMAAQGDLLFVTKNGQVKRSAAAEYGIRRSRFAAINLKGDDEVLSMAVIAPDAKGDMMLVTHAGLALRFKLAEIPTTGRATAGVRGIALDDGDAVAWATLPKAGNMLLVITDRGFGKRMLADDVDRQKRAGKGQRLMPKNAATGLTLAGFADVTRASAVTFEQKHGQTTQLRVGEVAVERRTGKGQMLVSVLLDDVVVSARAEG